MESGREELDQLEHDRLFVHVSPRRRHRRTSSNAERCERSQDHCIDQRSRRVEEEERGVGASIGCLQEGGAYFSILEMEQLQLERPGGLLGVTAKQHSSVVKKILSYD
eukprot:TRINITY_DN13665_c0_g1_i1.p2 TRINITY_DN13665_c0_g1~~TRINITY_DN13665_c0_g1_i1.p2  ORF type:complete len:108 (-),score=15.92 TRINITY_DN13665_c0_g1_i1:198-521(-)